MKQQTKHRDNLYDDCPGVAVFIAHRGARSLTSRKRCEYHFRQLAAVVRGAGRRRGTRLPSFATTPAPPVARFPGAVGRHRPAQGWKNDGV